MSAPIVREKTILTIGGCRVQLLSQGVEGPVADDDVIASGTLRCRLRPAARAAELPTLTVEGSGHFSLQCTASTLFTAEAGRLVFEYPPGSGVACSLTAAEGALQRLAARLQRRGCKVQWVANASAAWAARGVESTGSFFAGAIRAVGAAAGSGVRAAGEAALGSGLLEPECLDLPPDAIGAAAGVRGVTRKAAGLAGKALDAAVCTIGTAAAAVSANVPEPTEQWMVDTKVVGASSLRAGGQVWQALQDVSAEFWKEFADTSSDVIGHKYGGEAGQAARDSMHAVGNVLEVKATISKKVVGIIAGKSSTQVADVLDGTSQPADPGPSMQLDVPLSSSELARVVVRNALSRAAIVEC